MKKKLKSSAGFSLVEMLCAVAVLMLLCVMLNSGLSAAMKTYYDLTAEAETPLEKAKAIYEFVTKYIADDGSESAGGERPVLDSVLEAGMGSYYDRAALMAGMLRSQGVPCRISVGYTGQGRHTEVDIQTEESGWSDGLMLYDGEEWQWTEEGDSAAAGSRYTVKFVY